MNPLDGWIEGLARARSGARRDEPHAHLAQALAHRPLRRTPG